MEVKFSIGVWLVYLEDGLQVGVSDFAVLLELEVELVMSGENEDSLARDGDSPLELGNGGLGLLLEDGEGLDVAVLVAFRQTDSGALVSLPRRLRSR